MLLYYITDRRQLPGDLHDQRSRLLDKIAEAAHAGVGFIQLRENDLSAREHLRLSRQAAECVAHTSAKLLIHSRADIAIAAGAAGVHLTSDDMPAGDARVLWSLGRPIIAVSCHSVDEVRMADAQGADFAVLAPVFDEGETPALGLRTLADACGRLPSPKHTEAAPQPARFPVLALGGVTLENAMACLAAGAAGIAGVRLFQDHDIAAAVQTLRSLP